ncbi:MAG: hypothetical protein EU532_07770 [Promethearchaeota archaeon]|nr:MAG: hypothetical protein EU532_07770 [Candidatus Lokiarchaeota archaeon]
MPKKTVLFDLNHNEMLNIYEEEFSEFLKLLESLNLRIKTNDHKNITEKLLQNIDILIIGNPIEEYFSSIEINCIVDFVRNGGNLLLISEYGADYLQKTNLNDISSKYFGIYFQKNLIKTYNNLNQNCSSILTIQNFTDHQITKQLREIVIGGGCSFLINQNSEPLFYSKECWTEVYNDLSKQWSKEEESLPQIMAVYTDYGRGKVVALGDIDIFSNDPNIGIKRLDNRKFIINLLNWFTEEKINDNDVLGWILNQLGGIQSEIKHINHKINNIIETTTILEKRISSLEDNTIEKDVENENVE